MAALKNHQQTVRAGTIAKVIALCLFLGGAGVGYVFQKSQIYQLTQQLEKRERVAAGLEDEARDLRRDIELLVATEQLEARIRDFRLELAKPNPLKVRTRPEPPLLYPVRSIDLVGPR